MSLDEMTYDAEKEMKGAGFATEILGADWRPLITRSGRIRLITMIGR